MDLPYDRNGILYYIGTRGYTQEWANPCDIGEVEVTCASLMDDSQPIRAVVGRSAVRCVSKAEENQWVCVDFKSRRVRPTHYTLRHYSMTDLEALREWYELRSCCSHTGLHACTCIAWPGGWKVTMALTG